MTILINIESAYPDILISDLKALRFEIIATRIAESWQSRPPETLVIASIPLIDKRIALGLYGISVLHAQDCLAVRIAKNIGFTIGTNPVPYSEEHFNVN